ncbi:MULTISPECIES: xanthine dehydrogenase family protein molybdopterin-binding subunit [Alphaproteobacteria]|uniref:Xanthine dehydrogenase n=2 Tax=Alphaproteobacteria TaxID=28211 RepID=A0A512HH49_9HYPH|nr:MULTISPECIES: xanthine dehydrogenase family protein molybdopterin-binding subunit [Alphaproteobacteria]GEO84783.1 xanthine dehydrogenase [Ciceribacter naphthalenivorans]GLR20596.1 xanthine dehydrogenase [Ciceribacter naphthalenivorans]GLT03452.1 xanthine dehydrogenase [Sphingomonas psychrolutea]
MSESNDFHYIGKPLARKEDKRLITGQGRYLDDIVVPGVLHACFVRSPHAHARILSVSADAARALPGVTGVFTGEDLDKWTNRLRLAPPIEGLHPTEIATLPIDKVRFHGDPVAVVVAQDRYVAEDAIELVEVEYEVLPAITSLEGAFAPDAALVDETLPSNLVSHQTFSAGNVAQRRGEAHAVVEASFYQHRQTHVPMETRGCAAVWDAGREHLTFHIGNQVPHPLRSQLSGRLGLSESQVTVISPDVGGGFGQKIALYREELTVAALARQLNRPVRWREDRTENLMAASHARENLCRTRTSVAPDGRILGLELDLTEDFGAYCFYPANYMSRVVAMILTGPYLIEDYAFEVKIALTNKCGNGPMRAPMAITSWVMDGTIDAIARQLDLDPLEVRRVNMLRSDDLPYRMATGEVLEDITPAETLESVVEAIDYEAFRKRQQALRAEGRYIGLGLCTVVESTTYGSAFYKSTGIAGSGHEAAWVRIEPSGVVNASVGLGATGQGYETAMSQAVAEGLGVDPSCVRIQIGNTDVAPYGMGSRGARGATAGGGSLYLCARKAREQVLRIAAHKLGLNSAQEMRLLDGQVERLINGEWNATGLSLADIARTAYLDPTTLPEGVAPGLDFSLTYDPPPMTYSNSSHACEVEVDIATGALSIARYVVSEDCGTVINPIVVRGQQQGAIAMGLSGALLEEVVYDENGQNLSATFAEYLVATACETPNFEILHHHTPNKRTPAGIKGMAEGGVMGAIGAVINAVNDALAPFGVVADRQPLSPQYLRSLLREHNCTAPQEEQERI